MINIQLLHEYVRLSRSQVPHFSFIYLCPVYVQSTDAEDPLEEVKSDWKQPQFKWFCNTNVLGHLLILLVGCFELVDEFLASFRVLRTEHFLRQDPRVNIIAGLNQTLAYYLQCCDMA